MESAFIADRIGRPPSPQASHLIASLSYYRERGSGLQGFRHAAPLAFPLLVNLGSPFRIALGRRPGRDDRQPSFAAGLFPGPVLIDSDGRAECVQVDLTPLGAFRFYGGAVADLAARMVDIEDVLGQEGRRLRERLAECPSPHRRLDLVEAFVVARDRHTPSSGVEAALALMERSAGVMRIGAIAREIGWGRKHFSHRFTAEVGHPPKTVALMLRFHRACQLARSRTASGWAGVAAEAGYADQAHLAHDFRVFAGETPTEWAARLAVTDPRLQRKAGG